MIVTTVARLTLVEAMRRRVVWALFGLTAVLLALDTWGFASIPGLRTSFGTMTSGEARLLASELLNLVMFAMSLIIALGAAFLAGPTLSGELESGVALALLARPVPRWQVLAGKWLGLVVFSVTYVVVAGLVQFATVYWTTGYWPSQPFVALAMLAAEAIALLTLALLLSCLISPMASGVVSVGLFGSCWVAGVVGGIGEVLHNDGIARIGTIAHVLLPTDGLWRGAMHAIQDPGLFTLFPQAVQGFPFLAASAPSTAYLGWVAAWTLALAGLTLLSYSRRDV